MKLENYRKEEIVGDQHFLLVPAASKVIGNQRIVGYNHRADLMEADGYTEWTDEAIAAWHEQYDPIPTTCTKYELLRCLELKFPQLYTAFVHTLNTEQEVKFWWDTVVQLDRYDDKFDLYRTRLGISDEQLDAIFKAMRDTNYNLV